jgi:hypothetical protein
MYIKTTYRMAATMLYVRCMITATMTDASLKLLINIRDIQRLCIGIQLTRVICIRVQLAGIQVMCIRVQLTRVRVVGIRGRWLFSGGVQMYLHKYQYQYINIFIDIRTFIRPYIHTYIHTYIHVCIRTYI